MLGGIKDIFDFVLQIYEFTLVYSQNTCLEAVVVLTKVCACMCLYVYVCVYVCVCVYMCVCVYVRAYVCTSARARGRESERAPDVHTDV